MHMLVVACHVIWLFCTSPLKITQITKTLIELFPAIDLAFAQTFLMLNSIWHLAKVLIHCSVRSKCIQLESCVSQWLTGHKFGAYGTRLAHQRLATSWPQKVENGQILPFGGFVWSFYQYLCNRSFLLCLFLFFLLQIGSPQDIAMLVCSSSMKFRERLAYDAICTSTTCQT